MSSRLQDIDLVDLLPSSIKDDPQFAAASVAITPLLRILALSIPNLLIFGRMGNQTPESMIASLGRVTAARGGLAKPSTELVEQLAWQFHVDFRETAKTTEQLAQMVLQSIPWHRIKGTPASLKAAFALFGLAVSIEEDGEGDYWATYQLGLSEIADLESVRLIGRIAHEMQPARCRMYRIYTDVWDVRPGSYDVGLYDVEAYDCYSGVAVPGLPDGGDVVVSFGRKTAAQALPVLSVLFIGRLRNRSSLACDEDELRYDAAFYDVTEMPRNHGFVRSRLNSIVVGRPVYLRYGWTGAWDERKWLDLETVGYVRESFTFSRRSIAALEGLYDESAYDDLNTFYGQPVYTLADDPAKYDDGPYDAHDPLRRRVVVDEIFIEPFRAHADEPLLPDAAAGAGVVTRRGFHAAQAVAFFPPAPRWTGTWDERIWRVGGAFANVTREETEETV